MDLTSFMTPSFCKNIALYCQQFVLAAVLMIARDYGTQ